MALQDRLSSKILDIDLQITATQIQAAARVAELQASKASLERILALLTPELDQAVRQLQKFGFLKEV